MRSVRPRSIAIARGILSFPVMYIMACMVSVVASALCGRMPVAERCRLTGKEELAKLGNLLLELSIAACNKMRPLHRVGSERASPLIAPSRAQVGGSCLGES